MPNDTPTTPPDKCVCGATSPDVKPGPGHWMSCPMFRDSPYYSDNANEKVSTPATERKPQCEECGAWLVRDCLRCGAPNCCPMCCLITEQAATIERMREESQALRGAHARETDKITSAVSAEQLAKFRDALKAASEERYEFLQTCRAESEKWKAENDMYGWNFHQGMAGGANWADLFYCRVIRQIEAMLPPADAKESRP